MRKEASQIIKTTIVRQLKLVGPNWGAGNSPKKQRPESHLRSKSVSKKMGHSKTSSMVNRLYSGNKGLGQLKNDPSPSLNTPKKPVSYLNQSPSEKIVSNDKVLKYLEDTLAQYETQMDP
jgi:hypothetical protein